MLSFPIHLSNSVETLPMAPITTGTISTFLNSRNFLISFFKCWYFSTFSFSSAFTSIIIRFCSFLSITIRSGHLASIRLSHWIFMSHSTLISSYSTASSGVCSYYFSLCLTCSFYKYTNGLSLQHFRVVFCILFETIFHIRLLCVAHFHRFSHTTYTGGFHWSYRCGTSHSLFSLPAPVRHTTMLLFQPLNHLLITIATFFSLSILSIVSLMNCPCIRFLLHFTFSSLAFCFLNSTLVIVSLVLTVPAADTPLIRFSFELAT